MVRKVINWHNTIFYLRFINYYSQKPFRPLTQQSPRKSWLDSRGFGNLIF